MSNLNLHQRIVQVMKTMGAIGKSGMASYGDHYAYHRIDDIDDKLRMALVEHGVIAFIKEIRDRKLEGTQEVDKWGKPKTTWYAECLIVISLVNADNPVETLDIVGWGQGLDNSDKATGKAISYAAKAAYLSAFHLRGQPDNEADNIPRGGESKPAAVHVESPKELALVSDQAQLCIDAVNQCDCIEDLERIGDGLAKETADVKNAVRPYFVAKKKALKAGKPFNP